jgi:hypothetical protein
MEKITDKIKSFEDACKHLRLNPNDLPVVDMLPEKDRKSIIAFYKLTIIIRALNEGWEPDWSNWDEWKYSEEKQNFIPFSVVTKQVDGIEIKEDVFYTLQDGKFKELEQQ